MFHIKTNPVIQRQENPYVTGNAVGGSKAFVGRVDIIQAVENILIHEHNNAITLFGQRRVGKTSVLKELEVKLPEKGQFQPIYFDLMNRVHQPLETVVDDLTKTICQKLKLDRPQWENPVDSFRTWIEGLLDDSMFNQKSLVLLFDEFDALEDNQAEKMREEFFRYLKNLLSLNTKRLNIVFAIGRNIDDFNVALALLKNHDSRLVSLLFLKETEDLICLSEQNKSLRWSKSAIKKVIAYTNGHALFTQLLCSSIWQQLWNQKPTRIPKVTPQIVERNVERVFTQGQGQSALTWLWEGLPAACRVDAAAFAELGQQKISHQALVTHLHQSGIGMIMPELETAPRTLKEWDIIQGDAENGYRFRVELFRQWIVKYKPLKEIMQEELGRIRVEANEYYQQGQSFYQSGNFTQASDSLRLAIRINSHFIEAHQLLAKALIEKEEITEAQTALEKFYQCCPEIARPQLTELLWQQVESDNDWKKQLTLCEQILYYDITHTSAKNKIREILRWQGQRLEENRENEKAIQAYRKAGLEDKVRELRWKIIWSKYGKYVKRVGIFFIVFFISIFVSYLFVTLSLSWTFWGLALSLISGIVFTFLIEKIPFAGKNQDTKKF